MSSITSEQLLFAAFGLLLLGAIATSLYARDWRRSGAIAVVFAAAATIALWILAARAFVHGEANVPGVLFFTPLGASLTFHIDMLSAIFLFVVPFVGLAALLYAVEYMNKVHAGYSPRRYYPFALLLMAAIVGVVTSSDLFFFFIFWELMTLVSWVLVWFDREDETKVRAAWQYFIVTHVASACMLVAALVIYTRAGSFAFGDVAREIGLMAQTSPALVHILMALFLIGFVTKAGMFPFGGWLPSAYPAAPSPASAAFAGSMTKLGIYGVVRVAFEFFQTTGITTVWGGIIAVLGAASIFVGTLTALREDDAKRVLSFHIIGQIGYMLLAVGTALFFLRSNAVIASMALIAGLYHVVNHAIYKSLLFLNVGAAEYRTGTRDLNKLGGLGEFMPVTMAAAIIASLSIAGIPPLSGFASKWLIYQSTIQGGMSVPMFLILGIVAMFISLVTLASFMKLLGSVFLGKPAIYPESAKCEVPLSMRIPQLALSAMCIVLGVLPILPLTLLYASSRDVLGSSTVPAFASLFGTSPWGVTLSSGGAVAAVWNPAYMIVAAVLCGVGAFAFSRAGRAHARQVEGWYGGEEAAPDEIRYRAHGFCLPFKQVFLKVYPALPVPRIRGLRFIRGILDFDKWLYDPFVNVSGRTMDRFSRTHSGVPQLYMVWQLAGVVLVLTLLFILFA